MKPKTRARIVAERNARYAVHADTLNQNAEHPNAGANLRRNIMKLEITENKFVAEAALSESYEVLEGPMQDFLEKVEQLPADTIMRFTLEVLS